MASEIQDNYERFFTFKLKNKQLIILDLLNKKLVNQKVRFKKERLVPLLMNMVNRPKSQKQLMNLNEFSVIKMLV